jgi:hypothetical protein
VLQRLLLRLAIFLLQLRIRILLKYGTNHLQQPLQQHPPSIGECQLLPTLHYAIVSLNYSIFLVRKLGSKELMFQFFWSVFIEEIFFIMRKQLNFNIIIPGENILFIPVIRHLCSAKKYIFILMNRSSPKVFNEKLINFILR